MKKLLLCIFPFLILSSSLSFSQTQRLDYKKIDYISVDQDKLQQFLKMAEEVMKPAYQEMVDSEDIRSWELYIVSYPGGERTSYNMVCVVTSSKIETLQNKFSKVGSISFMPVDSDKGKANELASLSELMASEIWKVRAMLPRDTMETKPAKYMMMDYMYTDEGNGTVYLVLEDEVAKPLHQERINQNKMAGWEVYSLVTPGGTNYGYSYATGNFFENLADIEFGFTSELIKATLPGKNVKELLDTIYETRDLVKSELWELAVYTN